MRDLVLRLLPLVFGCALGACAAFDGVAPKDIELSDLAAPDAKDSRSLESFDRKSSDSRSDSMLGGARRAPSPARTADAEPAVRPRPDGPNMDIYRSGRCDDALKSVSADGDVPPRTRALASQVLGCTSSNGHYDLRHAPCQLFAPGSDDRIVDVTIQELRVAAPACNEPPL